MPSRQSARNHFASCFSKASLDCNKLFKLQSQQHPCLSWAFLLMYLEKWFTRKNLGSKSWPPADACLLSQCYSHCGCWSLGPSQHSCISDLEGRDCSPPALLLHLPVFSVVSLRSAWDSREAVQQIPWAGSVRFWGEAGTAGHYPCPGADLQRWLMHLMCVGIWIILLGKNYLLERAFNPINQKMKLSLCKYRKQLHRPLSAESAERSYDSIMCFSLPCCGTKVFFAVIGSKKAVSLCRS